MKIIKLFIYNILYLIIRLRYLDKDRIKKKYQSNLTTYYTNETITFSNYKYYKIIGKTKSKFLNYFNNYHFENAFLLSFNEVILVGKKNRTPILLTKKYEPILESCDNSFYCFKNSGSIFDIYKSIFKKKEKINKIVFFTGTMASNAYHWYTQYLPRLEFIIKYLYKENYKVLLDKNPTNFQIESLKLLGINEDRFIKWNEKPLIIENCLIPSLRHKNLIKGMFDIQSRNSYSWIRNTILKNINTNNNNKNKNILITRNDTFSRRLINENELIKFLKNYNFEIINLSNLTQNQIIEYFNNASIVIGVHGAAFTYTLFCGKAKIIEIFPEDYKEIGNKISTHNCLNSYFQISSFLDISHYVYIVKSEKNFNVNLNINDFKNFFKKNII